MYFQPDGKTWTYTFRHVHLNEFPNLKDFNAEYRTTMKLRLLFDGPAPKVEKLETYTDSVWRETEVEIEWGCSGEKQVWDGRLETFNGFVNRLSPLALCQGAEVQPDGSWRSTTESKPSGVQARFWYTRV